MGGRQSRFRSCRITGDSSRVRACPARSSSRRRYRRDLLARRLAQASAMTTEADPGNCGRISLWTASTDDAYWDKVECEEFITLQQRYIRQMACLRLVLAESFECNPEDIRF